MTELKHDRAFVYAPETQTPLGEIVTPDEAASMMSLALRRREVKPRFMLPSAFEVFIRREADDGSRVAYFYLPPQTTTGNAEAVRQAEFRVHDAVVYWLGQMIVSEEGCIAKMLPEGEEVHIPSGEVFVGATSDFKTTMRFIPEGADRDKQYAPDLIIYPAEGEDCEPLLIEVVYAHDVPERKVCNMSLYGHTCLAINAMDVEALNAVIVGTSLRDLNKDASYADLVSWIGKQQFEVIPPRFREINQDLVDYTGLTERELRRMFYNDFMDLVLQYRVADLRAKEAEAEVVKLLQEQEEARRASAGLYDRMWFDIRDTYEKCDYPVMDQHTLQPLNDAYSEAAVERVLFELVKVDGKVMTFGEFSKDQETFLQKATHISIANRLFRKPHNGGWPFPEGEAT